MAGHSPSSQANHTRNFEISATKTDAEWEGKPSGRSGILPPILQADGFEGPLDWLVELATTRQIDLAKVSIKDLVQSFATALEEAIAGAPLTGVALARWGDWLVMATTLALLRSRLLLPADPEEAKDAIAEANRLRQSLLDRQAAKAGADWLDARLQLGRDVFARGTAEEKHNTRFADITDLMRAMLEGFHTPVELTRYQPKTPPFWPVRSALFHISKTIKTKNAGSPLTDYVPTTENKKKIREAICSTLVAGMEMTRQGEIKVEQDKDWDEIRVYDCQSA